MKSQNFQMVPTSPCFSLRELESACFSLELQNLCTIWNQDSMETDIGEGNFIYIYVNQES